MSYSYVALGDSLTGGVGASLFSPGFVQRYQRMAMVDLGEPVFVQVFAQPGFQSQDVLLELKDNFVKEQIKEAKIITITAGGNDLIQAAEKYEGDHNEKDFSHALKKCMDHYRKIIKEMMEIKKDSGSPYIIRIVNLYNPFPENPLAVKWINQFNTHLKKFEKGSIISIAEMDKVFKGHESEFLSPDGVHPNDIGYERIAIALQQLGFAELSNDWEEE